MSQTLLSLAGFQVITIGRFWVIAEVLFRRLYRNFPYITAAIPCDAEQSCGSLQYSLPPFSTSEYNPRPYNRMAGL